MPLKAIPLPPGYKKESWGFEVSPSINFDWKLEQTQISLGYTYTYKWYENKPVNSTDNSDQAHVIKAEVGKLMEDVGRLKERASDLRRHFDMANSDLEKLGVSADRISKRGVKIESMDLEETPKGAALDAPRPRLINTV